MWTLLLACTKALVPLDTAPADTEPADTAPTDTETADSACTTAWHLDGDGDGYGQDDAPVVACDAPDERYVERAGDCADADAAIYPGSTQQIDGLDSDCDGRKDWWVTFYVTADDAFDACLDHETNLLGSGASWGVAYVYERWLPSGTHTLGIKGWDLGRVITAAAAEIRTNATGPVVTDASWRYDPQPAEGPGTRTGWCSSGFDDSAWQGVNVIGPVFTTSPWTGAPVGFPEDSQAQWVWDHFPVDLNTQYLRKEFTLP